MAVFRFRFPVYFARPYNRGGPVIEHWCTFFSLKPLQPIHYGRAALTHAGEPVSDSCFFFSNRNMWLLACLKTRYGCAACVGKCSRQGIGAQKVPREQILTRMANNRVCGTRNVITADVVPGLLKKGDAQLPCVKSFGGTYRELCAWSECLKYSKVGAFLAIACHKLFLL